MPNFEQFPSPEAHQPSTPDQNPEQAKKPEKIESLIKNASDLVQEISTTYVDLKKWEFLLNYPDDNKDSFLANMRPQIEGLLADAYKSTQEIDKRLRDDLSKTCEKLEASGFGFIAKETLASLSVLENKNT